MNCSSNLNIDTARKSELNLLKNHCPEPSQFLQQNPSTKALPPQLASCINHDRFAAQFSRVIVIDVGQIGRSQMPDFSPPSPFVIFKNMTPV